MAAVLSLIPVKGCDAMLEPAFEHGMFYADPHPGNLLLEDDGSLAVIDFGKIEASRPQHDGAAPIFFLP